MPLPAPRGHHKKKDPTARITWLVNDTLSPVVELCADVDEVLFFKRHQWNKPRGVPDFLRFLTTLRKRQWDIVIDAQGLFRSGMCTSFAGNGMNTWGFADAREMAPRFYKNRVTVPPQKTHAVDKYLHLIGEVLGINATYTAPRFRDDPELDAKASALAHEQGFPQDKLIGIAVASRWTTKNWPPTFFARVIEIINKRLPDHHLWLLGAPNDREIADEVLRHCNVQQRLHDLVGKTDVPTMITLLRRSRVLVSNDSGPMHISAAVSTPVVAMFGPTSPEKTAPYGNIHRVFHSEAECSPCFRRTCPLPRQLCYDDVITPEAVAGAVCERIQQESSSPGN